MNITVTFPSACLCGPDPKRELIALAQHALDLGLTPEPVPSGMDSARLLVHLPHATRARLLAARPDGMPVSVFVARLAYAACQHQRRIGKRAAERAGEGNPDPGVAADLRPEQRKLLAGLRKGMGAGKVVFAEAGTGIGKTRVACLLAEEVARDSAKAAIIAVPTLSVLSHYCAEWGALGSPEGTPSPAILLERACFVSPAAVRRVLSEKGCPDDLREPVLSWLDAGGPRADAGSPTTSALHRLVPWLRWLKDDLLAVAPAFPVEEALLDDTVARDCPAHEIYWRLRKKAAESRIVICTHTMLALHHLQMARQHDPILPPADSLLIDEAHEFEEAVASIHSASLSLWRLRHYFVSGEVDWSRCRARMLAEQAHRQVADLFAELRQYGMRTSEGRVRIGPGAEGEPGTLEKTLRARLPGLGMVLSAIAEKCPAARDVLDGPIRICRGFLEEGHASWVEFSPTLRYPSIATGPVSVRNALRSIWGSVRAAGLLSGTLTLPKMDGQPSIAYLGQVLAVPSERREMLEPLAPSWLYAVELHAPGRDNPALIPPSERDHPDAESYAEAVSAWLDEVATQISTVVETARGGVLCLMTSYDQISCLAERMEGLGERLIAQTRGAGFAACRARFLELARAGRRPVWLATGPAWTGLDLADPEVPAAQDFLLTDLVIPRVPYGMNRSTTHAMRQQWMRTAERDRAALQFRQGLGRLIRREGVQYRRLWVLDARIWASRWKWLMAPMRRSLDRYTQA